MEAIDAAEIIISFNQPVKKRPAQTNAQRCKKLREKKKKMKNDATIISQNFLRTELFKAKLQIEMMTMQLYGYIIMPPPADLSNIHMLRSYLNIFKERYHSMTSPQERRTITGSFSQIQLSNEALEWIAQSNFFGESVLPPAERIFRSSLSREDLEVKIHQGAILKNPLHSETSTPQEFHADNVGFISLIVIIMMTQGGGHSTHIIPRFLHGNDYHAPRDNFLSFTIDTHKNEEFNGVRNDIKWFYGKLLEQKSEQLFSYAPSSHLPYGGFEIFRSDLIHAGPVSAQEREVLFIELRVRDEDGPNDEDYQFKLKNLNTIIDAQPKTTRTQPKTTRTQPKTTRTQPKTTRAQPKTTRKRR